MSTAFLVKFSGLFLGILARTVLPWLRKVREGRVRGFGRRYLYSALASLAIGLILTLVLFPRFEAGAEGRSVRGPLQALLAGLRVRLRLETPSSTKAGPGRPSPRQRARRTTAAAGMPAR
ncbi:MAG: hypothetical protein M0C28_24120 [Candidatus Moduliflexus flocculans]|nr:hypothetical protein [Candidatus Moduliflexus flocculans]